jgi:hypothetical protein
VKTFASAVELGLSLSNAAGSGRNS